MSRPATVIQTAVRPKHSPAVWSTSEYCFAAFKTLSQTQNIPGTAAPNRLSALLTVFQVSPIDKCSMSARMVGSKKCPCCPKTRVVLYALSGATMSTHMIGKVTPGGVHDGIWRSLKPRVFSPFIALSSSGRLLLSGEKTRLLRLRAPNSRPVTGRGREDCSVPLTEHATSRRPKKHDMPIICTAIAPPYLVIASLSRSLVVAAFKQMLVRQSFRGCDILRETTL